MIKLLRHSYTFFFLLLFTQACFRVDMQPYYYTETSSPVTNYSKGEIQSSFVGDKMIEYTKGLTTPDQYLLLSDIDFKSRTIEKGTIFNQSHSYNGECKDGTLVLHSDNLHPWVGIIVNNNLEVVCKNAFITLEPPSLWRRFFIQQERRWEINGNLPRKLFTKQKGPVIPEPTGLTVELVYLGSSGNTLRLGYREYSKEDYGARNLRRSAFDEELTYNLTTSRLIRFREFQLDIISAGNSEIKFIVLRDPSS